MSAPRVARTRSSVELFLGLSIAILLVPGCGGLTTEADTMHDLTAELASLVRADRVVRVFRTFIGADLYPVWRRPGIG